MRLIAALCALALAASAAAAQTQQAQAPLLGSLFQDHAVLQRDKPIAVWGKAKAGEQVMLQLAGKTATATAGADGAWHAKLPALPAGGPHELSVRTPTASQTVSDILIGDVWLCSGQSNMVLEVRRALNAPREIAGSADNKIRFITIGLDSNATPLPEFRKPAKWLVAGPETVADFSAACFFFAKDLRQTIDVPMGLVNAAWGGSTIQSWMSTEALGKQDGYGEGLAVLALSVSDPPASQQRWGRMWETWWLSKNRHKPWAGEGAWTTAPKMEPWEAWGVAKLAAYNGMVWYRAEVTLTGAQAAQPARLMLGNVDEVDQTWINGQPVGASGSGDRDYAVPPELLKAGRNSIVVNALDTYMAGGIYGPPEKRKLAFADGSSVALDTGGWSYQIADGAYGPPPRAPWESLAGLSTIANAMIAPMHDYAFRGVLWYQGESNAERNPETYDSLLAGLMADWRGRFGANLPFLVVQLANYGQPPTAPGPSGWAELRERQRMAVEADRHAGLAVAIDIGDRWDIHPANKAELAHRLARAARHVVYGSEAPPSGPWAVSAKRLGGMVTVRFKDVTGGLKVLSSSSVVGFELCDAAGSQCHYARATAQGSEAWLAAPPDTPAEVVRFCWADSPVCNLYDGAGLPAGPFRLKVE
jgi:sialate O-acetylesterase